MYGSIFIVVYHVGIIIISIFDEQSSGNSTVIYLITVIVICYPNLFHTALPYYLKLMSK